MTDTTRLICITCPMGCSLDVSHDGTTVLEVSGNACKRGIEYAQAELSDPRRMIATTVRVSGGIHPLVPVFTDAPFPKPLVFDLLAELRELELCAPVEANQVVLPNALGTGVNVLTSRALPQAQHIPEQEVVTPTDA
jgi:CxxC motif-containing protein